MKCFVYESHLGGFYFQDEELSIEDLYCEECGDMDILYGEVETVEELRELLSEEDNYFTEVYIEETIKDFKDKYKISD